MNHIVRSAIMRPSANFVKASREFNQRSTLIRTAIRFSSSCIHESSKDVFTSSSWCVSFVKFSRPIASLTTGRRHIGTSSKNLDREVSIPPGAVTMSFTTSQGPGGQNVNKVATCCEIRFEVASADWVGDAGARARLAEAEKGRMNTKGELVVSCQEHRTQANNRSGCLLKVKAMVASARIEPKERAQYAGISNVGKTRRKDEKRNRAKVKENRGNTIERFLGSDRPPSGGAECRGAGDEKDEEEADEEVDDDDDDDEEENETNPSVPQTRRQRRSQQPQRERSADAEPPKLQEVSWPYASAPASAAGATLRGARGWPRNWIVLLIMLANF